MGRDVVNLGGEDNIDKPVLPVRSVSKSMREVEKQIGQVSPTDLTVLVNGASGAGKEEVAKAIHQKSPRASKPFITVNCAGLTESILTSQLFGHKRGAFTGAIQDQQGFFQAAEGGTIFLDEIGDIPALVQMALLRVLQGKEITCVGETKPRKVDVRVIAATNKNLEEEIKQGKFREDLYYRLTGFVISLPALRDRKEDLPALIDYFLTNPNLLGVSKHCKISDAAQAELLQYHWPGNIRVLMNVLGRAVSQCSGDTIIPEYLSFLSAHQQSTEDDKQAGVGLVQTSDKNTNIKITKEIFQKVWKEFNGNVELVARELRRSRRTVYRWIEKYGLKPIDKHIEQFPEALSP